VAITRDLKPSPRRCLPARLLSARFTRSSGPGGQNVNKVATRVELRLDLEGCVPVLGEAGVRRIRGKLARRLDSEGRLLVAAGRSRHRSRNLEAAHLRMEELLGEALHQPTARRATRPSRASKERRLDTKRQRAGRKRDRRRPELE
jgi:ribosome-associated protein